MNRFEWTQINGRVVLKQDFSHLENLELMKLLNHSHEVIKDSGERDIIVITNMDDVVFDAQSAKQFCKLLEAFLKMVIILGDVLY